MREKKVSCSVGQWCSTCTMHRSTWCTLPGLSQSASPVRQRWDWRTCPNNAFPGDVDPAGQGTHWKITAVQERYRAKQRQGIQSCKRIRSLHQERKKIETIIIIILTIYHYVECSSCIILPNILIEILLCSSCGRGH